MAVQKFLDASTRHITQQDNTLLLGLRGDTSTLDGSLFPIRVIPHTYGWWVNVTSEPGELDEYIRELTAAGMSEAFCTLLRYARERECWWINLDRDAEELDDLPTFDW